MEEIIRFGLMVFLGMTFFADVLLEYLNVKASGQPLPEELNDVYEPEAYDKSQRYLRKTTRLGWLAGSFQFGVLVVFWFSGGFGWLDVWVRSFGWPMVWSGLMYVAALLLGYSTLLLPFSVYQTFVIEAEFGFNKTTPKIFILDLLKGMALSMTLGGFLLAVVLAIFEAVGSLAWFYSWLLVSLFTFVLQYLAPTYLMPLFNTFKPLEDGSLRENLTRLAEQLAFPLDQIFVMDGSKRSNKANAFFTGWGKRKRVVFFDTLLEKHGEEEIMSIFAHEVGHYKRGHVSKNMVISTIHSLFMFWVLSVVLVEPGVYAAFFVEQASVYVGFVLFGLLYAPAEFVLSLMMNALSRRFEFEADAFAVKGTGKKMPMIQALKKLSADNLSNLTPHHAYVWANYSHPPLLERKQAIERVDL